MRLCRYGPPGHETPGLIDDAGMLRSLSGHLDDLTPATVTPQALAGIAALDPQTLPPVSGEVRYGVPIAGIGKFLAIGLNYADHARESGVEPPAEPIIFTKAISCLAGPNEPIMLPRGSKRTDWEVELGVVIGSPCRHVDECEALDHVAGFVLANDLSERTFQNGPGGQWDKGKGCDTFGPLGPWLVTRDEIADCQDLDLFLDVNGARMQTGNTRTMIFPVAVLIAYVSRFITLLPGDVLITGTPPGVGNGRTPPVFLKPGDEVRAGIAGLGEQRQRVVAWRVMP